MKDIIIQYSLIKNLYFMIDLYCFILKPYLKGTNKHSFLDMSLISKHP